MPNVLYFNFVFDPQGTRPEDFKVTMTDSTKTVSSKLLPIDAKGYLVMPLSGTAPFSLVIKKGTAIAATFTLNEEEVEKATQNDAEKPDIYRVLYYQVVPEKKAIKSIPAPPRPADIVPVPILSSIKEVITIKEVSPVNETPPAPVVTAAPIVYAPLEPVKTKVMKGRALDKTGKPFKNTTFIIYAGNPSDGGTKDLKMQPLASGTTDSSGNFSIAMPNSEFLDAMAVLGIAPNIPIDIVLEKNKMPDFALLVLEKAETTTESGHEHDDDCACHDKLGRLPEMDDLLDPESKYQQDIGGSCVNFTTPNRALEEFSYFSVVRHTDPEVMNAPGYIENLKLKIKEIERTVANLKKPKSLTSEASSFILYDLMKLQKDAPDVQGGWDWSKLQSEINAILSMGELIGEAVNPRLFNIPAESYFGKGSNPKVFLGFVIQWHRNFLYSDPNAEIVTPPTSVAIADLGRIRNTVLATHNNVMWDYQALILNIFNTESFNATAIHVNEPISPQIFTWCNDWYNTWVNCGSLFKNVVDKFTTEQNRYLTQTPAPIRKPLGNGGQLPTSNVIRALAALKKRDSLSFTDIRATIDNLTKSLKMGNSKETLATRVKGFSEADYNNIGSDPNVLVNFLIQQQVKHLTGNRDWNAAQGTTNSIADRNSQNVDWLEIELERLQNELRYAEFNKNKAINRTGVGVNNRIQWDTHLPIVQPATIAHGHLLNFRQVWRADGYSMGDLLYSLPLAPGQQKQIVIRDWERKEVASRSEEQTVEEAIDSSLDTNRDINEIVSASLKEQSEGKSKATTSGMGGGMGYSAAASGSASVGGIPINARMGVSGGFSASYGKGKSESQQKSSRDTTASTMQKVRDSVMQHSSAMRSQRSTVVTTMTQSESSHITTESIANYNHCHAITIQYFEVLRHLAVYNELAGIQECLFIPLSMSLFDDSKIIRWIDLLLPALRAPRMKYADLQRGFEAVRRYHDVHILNKNEEEVYHNVPRGRYCDERITQINGNLRLAISIACPAKITNPITEELTKTLAALRDSGSLFASLMNNVIINQNDDQRNWQQTLGFIKEVDDIRQKVNKAEDDKREEMFQAELIRVNAVAQLARHLQMTVGNPNPNRVNARFSLTRSSSDRSNGQVPTFDFSFRTAADRLSIERDDIQTLGIGLNNNAVRLPAGSSITVERLTANYRSRYINARLVDSRPSEDLLAGAVNIYTPLDDSEMVSPRQEDVRLRNELIDHLNSNMEYYHKAIWVQMDEDRRYMLLEGFTIEVPPRENPAYAPGNGEPQFLSQREYRSVASVVENRLIGIAGNSIIMPVANGYNLNPVFRFADDEVEIEGRKISKLMAYYMPEKGFKDTPFRISIPTKGVFAEAVQGACNSCEKIDDSRYWKWEEHPIPNKPTEITPVGLENLRVAPENMMPSEMAAAILKQQEGRNLPAPTGMDKAMELLGKTSTFNDITGLKGNQENAAAALKINSEAAQKYAEMAKDIAKSVEIPKNAAAYIDAVKRSGLPEKDQNELIKKYLGGEMGENGEDKNKGKGGNENGGGGANGGGGNPKPKPEAQLPKYDEKSTRVASKGSDKKGDYVRYADGRKVYVDEDGKAINSGITGASSKFGTYTIDNYGREIYDKHAEEQLGTTNAAGEVGEGSPNVWDDPVFDPYYEIEPIRQPNDKVCWAAVVTMMMNWKTGDDLEIRYCLRQCADIDSTIPYDQTYERLFAMNKVLKQGNESTLGTKAHLIKQLGMTQTGNMTLIPIGFQNYLKQYGPLWVTTDEDLGAGIGLHARVLVGIDMTTDPDDPMMCFIDPATGEEEYECYSDFFKKHNDAHPASQIRVVYFGDDNGNDGSDFGDDTDSTNDLGEGLGVNDTAAIYIIPQGDGVNGTSNTYSCRYVGGNVDGFSLIVAPPNRINVYRSLIQQTNCFEPDNNEWKRTDNNGTVWASKIRQALSQFISQTNNPFSNITLDAAGQIFFTQSFYFDFTASYTGGRFIITIGSNFIFGVNDLFDIRTGDVNTLARMLQRGPALLPNITGNAANRSLFLVTPELANVGIHTNINTNATVNPTTYTINQNTICDISIMIFRANQPFTVNNLINVLNYDGSDGRGSIAMIPNEDLTGKVLFRTTAGFGLPANGVVFGNDSMGTDSSNTYAYLSNTIAIRNNNIAVNVPTNVGLRIALKYRQTAPMITTPIKFLKLFDIPQITLNNNMTNLLEFDFTTTPIGIIINKGGTQAMTPVNGNNLIQLW